MLPNSTPINIVEYVDAIVVFNDALPHPSQTFSWALVTSKNLPPTGTVASSGISPHVVKGPSSQVIDKEKFTSNKLNKGDEQRRCQVCYYKWVTTLETTMFSSVSLKHVLH